MPDPYERHARTKDPSGWEGQNPRSARKLAAEEPPAKTPPSKLKHGECKGPDGWKPQHTRVLVLRKLGIARGCEWGLDWRNDGPRWFCRHEAHCADCGKLLEQDISYACPDRHPVTDEDQARLDQQLETRKRWKVRSHKEEKARTSYRKPKGG